jgi:hypothetical protein
MLLKVKGIELKPSLKMHEYIEGAPEDYAWRKPDHLVPLFESQWPSNVIREIEGIFKAIGVKEPRWQKLVEPNARVFGGVELENGTYSLARVNWERAVDWFRFEASAWTRLDSPENEAAHKKLTDALIEKYDGLPAGHQQVYSDGSCPFC